MTESKLAATRQNQKRCHGPVTPEGRERIRNAHLRHGFYAKAEQVALRTLGENPEHFESLLESLWEEFTPEGSLQEGLVIRLARAMWLLNRADRIQEGFALRQAHQANYGRENRLHAQMMRLKMTADSLRLLAHSVSFVCYVTTKSDLAMMKNLHQEEVIGDMGEIALALFYQMQVPGTNAEGDSPEEQQRKVLIRIKEIFGVNTSPDPPQPQPQPQTAQENAAAADAAQTEATGEAPTADATEPEATEDAAAPIQPAPCLAENYRRYTSISHEEWLARERPRQLLENILNRQVEVCGDQRKTILKELLKGPSPYERAAEIAPADRGATSLRKLQETYFREVRRVTDLLLKMQRHQAKQALPEADSSTMSNETQDLCENSAVAPKV